MPSPYHRALPLRVGLVAAMLLLVGCGLLASGIAVTSTLQHDLINRADQTLLDASRGWAQAPRRMPPPDEGPNPARPPSNFYVRGVDADGHIWMAVNDRDAEPALPDDNDVGPEPVTVGSLDYFHCIKRETSHHYYRMQSDQYGRTTSMSNYLQEVTQAVSRSSWSALSSWQVENHSLVIKNTY